MESKENSNSIWFRDLFGSSLKKKTVLLELSHFISHVTGETKITSVENNFLYYKDIFPFMVIIEKQNVNYLSPLTPKL